MSQATNVRAHQTTAAFIQPLAKNELSSLFHYLSRTLCADVEYCTSDDEREWIKPNAEGGPARTTQHSSNPEVTGAIRKGNMPDYAMVNFDSKRGSLENPTFHDGKTRALELYLSQHYAENNEAEELLNRAADAIKAYKPTE